MHCGITWFIRLHRSVLDLLLYISVQTDMLKTGRYGCELSLKLQVLKQKDSLKSMLSNKTLKPSEEDFHAVDEAGIRWRMKWIVNKYYAMQLEINFSQVSAGTFAKVVLYLQRLLISQHMAAV